MGHEFPRYIVRSFKKTRISNSLDDKEDAMVLNSGDEDSVEADDEAAISDFRLNSDL